MLTRDEPVQAMDNQDADLLRPQDVFRRLEIRRLLKGNKRVSSGVAMRKAPMKPT